MPIDMLSLPLIICLVLIVVLYGLYARIISRKNTAKAALSSIEVQLRKRFDLIPNVLKLAAKYMTHERELIEEVTRLRSNAQKVSHATHPDDVKQLFEADALLSKKFSSLSIAMENYPDLKAAQTTAEAMHAWNDVEDNIAAARRFYNSAVTDLNNAIEIFPGNFIAPLAKAKSMPMYEDADSEAIRKSIDANDYLK